MDFIDLLHREFLFYGVDGHLFKLDDSVFEVREDPDDGHRSWLDTIEVVDHSNGIFFRYPVAIVEVKPDFNYTGYKLVDDEGHEWLSFGTDESEESYPKFHFLYLPKPPSNKSKAAPKTKRIHDHDINSIDRLFDPRES